MESFVFGGFHRFLFVYEDAPAVVILFLPNTGKMEERIAKRTDTGYDKIKEYV